MAYSPPPPMTCLNPECERTATRRGACTPCYGRQRRGSLDIELLPPHVRMRRSGVPCAVPECDRPSRSRGWCHTHHMRVLRTGEAGTTACRPYEPKPKPTVDKYGGGRNSDVMRRTGHDADRRQDELYNPPSDDEFAPY